jgi:hypothetical protein
MSKTRLTSKLNHQPTRATVSAAMTTITMSSAPPVSGSSRPGLSFFVATSVRYRPRERL